MLALPANLIAVLACALVNYAASDRIVFLGARDSTR
jgi:putative flippase GtrA